MARITKSPKNFESTAMDTSPSNQTAAAFISQSLDASLDESSADELGPETNEEQAGLNSTTITPKKRGRPSLASRSIALRNTPPSENDIIVKERDGHRLKLVLYNQFRCGKCITSGQECIVEIGRKGSHVVRCELCIARNQSVTHCTLPLQTLLDLDEQNPHLRYTIQKMENQVKKNGLQSFTARKEDPTNAPGAAADTSISAVSGPISENRLREARARLNSLRKACEVNGDKFIASQLEDIISECLSGEA
ncbi:uncharacterized protein FA14DRAFT_161168 [Meira miltonrushii]|uniref:Uncharacterized protein n=1 Tax=Meira miltonrushii TaxID=1280837 RepID=A0A316V836_9BASI|nr:uncharacterized protein FA14DRAFT_161168 [Meira miltonrushii]PWN33188.1 hypothetical protein FA14DRAFT_161168 [Meira miltonrushii]